ncbi:zf-TFIIB domain-containing protein [Aquamicrobium sp.]|uniref:TFIIB-type zinc ribbon-containing protein n=1 Tax=Aquamicrobium sp. TaxID=1872579 RepID=UPI0025849089|nr:zf-TFIIB domain-containing protein [Aquamicrobium sp.]MCK9553198.1 zf-TFIIB domain-containing protein [Aquamicrobium sp.]
MSKEVNLKAFYEDHVCPHCGAEPDISLRDEENDGECYFQYHKCDDCGGTWTLRFTLDKIEANNGEDKEYITNEDYDMLASENKAMADFLEKLGFYQELINDIANGKYLDTKLRGINLDILKIRNFQKGNFEIKPNKVALAKWLKEPIGAYDEYSGSAYYHKSKLDWTVDDFVELIKDNMSITNNILGRNTQYITDMLGIPQFYNILSLGGVGSGCNNDGYFGIFQNSWQGALYDIIEIALRLIKEIKKEGV